MNFWKKRVFGSSNPSTQKNIENGSMEIRKKLGSKKTEKSLEISAFLALWRAKVLFSSSGSILTVRHGRGRRILNPCRRQYLRKPIVQSCADAANCSAICGVLHGIVHYEKGKKPMLPHRLLSFLWYHYKIRPNRTVLQNSPAFLWESTLIPWYWRELTVTAIFRAVSTMLVNESMYLCCLTCLFTLETQLYDII